MDCAYCGETLEQGQRMYNVIDVDETYHCCNDICARLLAKTWSMEYLECHDCDDILAKNTGVLRAGIYRCHACHDTLMMGIFTAAVYDSEIAAVCDCDTEPMEMTAALAVEPMEMTAALATGTVRCPLCSDFMIRLLGDNTWPDYVGLFLLGFAGGIGVLLASLLALLVFSV